MVDAAKEILEMVKHMPEYTLWVLIGLLFYKTVIIGSYFGVARLLILKTHDFMIKPKVVTHKINNSLLNEDAAAQVDQVFRSLRYRDKIIRGNKAEYMHDYLSSSDIVYLMSALDAKIIADKLAYENKPVKPNPFKI